MPDKLYEKYLVEVPAELQVSRTMFLDWFNQPEFCLMRGKSCLCGPCTAHGSQVFPIPPVTQPPALVRVGVGVGVRVRAGAGAGLGSGSGLGLGLGLGLETTSPATTNPTTNPTITGVCGP